MIYSTLVADMRSEAQLDNDTSWDARILMLINEELLNLANLQNQEQLHVTQVSRIAANQTVGQLVDLPTDFLKMDKVTFQGATNSWILPKNNGLVPPIPEATMPKCYELSGIPATGMKIALIPSIALGTKSLTISYFSKPPAVVAGDTIYPDSWIPPLKRAVMERVLNYHLADPARSADTFSKLNSQAEMGAVAVSKEIEKPDKGYDSPRSA